MSRPISQADAIVVLSGSGTFRERAQKAAALYNEGRSRRILLTNDNRQSSWAPAEQRNPYYYQLAIDVLMQSGVLREDVEVLGPPVASTYDEAVLLRSYCEKNGFHSLLVVTSAYLSRRALWTFTHLFQGSATEIGLDPVDTGIQTLPPRSWWLHLRGWEMVPTEYVKAIYYWFRLH